MTKREITSVALKVFAIYVLVQAILLMPVLMRVFIIYNTDVDQGNSRLLFWGVGILAIVLLLVLFVTIWKLSNNVINVSNRAPVSSEDNSINQPFILSVLGFYLTFKGLQWVGFSCVGATIQAGEGVDTLKVSGQTIAYIVGYSLQVIIGLTLILKASGWAALIRWLREAGLKTRSSGE